MKIDKVYVFFSALIVCSALLWVSSCRHDALIPSDFPEICFEKDVLPIFRNNCSTTGCHDGTGESDLVLNSYIPISHNVEAGDPLASELYRAIISRSGENRMPPDNPLSLENRTIIRLWIEQGARLTVCPDTSSQGNNYVNPRACFSRDILPVLISTCGMAGCHDAITHEEGYTFVSYSSTLSAVKPGKPSESKLYQVITTLSGEDRMPPEPYARMAQAKIDSIYKWISYGALDEYCGEVCDTINPVTFSGAIWPTIQTSCVGCHSGATPSGGVSLATYANIQSVAASGLLMNSLKGIGATKMPPAGSLSTCKISQFRIWVNNGSLNN